MGGGVDFTTAGRFLLSWAAGQVNLVSCCIDTDAFILHSGRLSAGGAGEAYRRCAAKSLRGPMRSSIWSAPLRPRLGAVLGGVLYSFYRSSSILEVGLSASCCRRDGNFLSESLLRAGDGREYLEIMRQDLRRVFTLSAGKSGDRQGTCDGMLCKSLFFCADQYRTGLLGY